MRQHNALTRLRQRSIFRKFLRAFQPGCLSQQVVMVKYLATLERLAPRFGTERVPVCHLELLSQADGEPCYIRDGGQAPPDPGSESAAGPPTHEVLVSGTEGIRWRLVPAEVSGVPLPSNSGGCGLLLSLDFGLGRWLWQRWFSLHGSGICLSVSGGLFLG